MQIKFDASVVYFKGLFEPFVGRMVYFCILMMSCFTPALVSSAELTLYDVSEPFVVNVGEDGSYPNGFITSIIQDSNRDIWFGTYEGLVRYDSHDFTSYKHDPQDNKTISGNLITHITPDNDGGIWISSYSTGLTYFNINKQILTQYTEQTETQPGLASNIVMATLLDGDKLWVATGKGLNLIDLKDNSIKFFDYHLDKDAKKGGVTSLAKDAEGKIWLGTTKGLYFVDQANSIIVPVLTPSIKGKSVYRLLYSDQNKLWLGTQKHGIAYLDTHTQQVTWLKSSKSQDMDTAWVMDFTVVNDTEMWVATFGGGIVVVDQQKNEIKGHLTHHKKGKKGLVSNDVSTVFMSEDKQVWIGHWGKYVQKTNLQVTFVRTFDIASFGLFDETVNAITELNNGTLLLGNDQLIAVTIENNALAANSIPSVEHALNQDIITTLSQDSHGNIWVGTRQSGLLQFDEQFALINHFNDKNDFPHQVIRFLIPSSDGGMWIGSNGLSKWDPKQGFIHFNIPANNRLQSESMLEATDGTLWLASFGQLYRVLPQSNKLELVIKNVSDIHPLAGNLISSLVEDKQQNLYFLSNNRLFSLLTSNSNAIKVELAPLYADFSIDGVRNLVIDAAQNIWTDKEFIDLAAKSKTKFYRRDGIDIGTGWNGGKLVSHNANIFFVGSRGLMVIDPKLAVTAPISSKVYITNLALDGNSQRLSNAEVMIKPETSEITFELNAKNFNDSSVMQYQYRLNGMSDEWIPISFKQRYITFRDLPPREYLFSARAKNIDNGAISLETSYAFKVLPHWFETVWFRGCAVLACLGLIFFGHALRVNLVKKQNAELELLVQERTKELEQKNAHIEELANHDPLTSLPNLRLATDRLSEALKRSKRDNNMTAVIYFDLDGFKLINDTYGHNTGDFILQSVADRVTKLIRETDTLCRIGGDEFLLILSGIERRELIEQLCERILNEFTQSVDWEGHQLMIRMSIGVAVYPIHGENGKALIHRADTVMYQVKKTGKFNYKIDDF